MSVARLILVLGVSITGPLAFAENTAVRLLLDACMQPLKAPKTWAKTTVIFDTNVVINDPEAIYKYPGARIILPGTLLEEVDGLKKDHDASRAAREFSRELDEILRQGGNFVRGVNFSNGSTVIIDRNNYTNYLSDSTYDLNKPDNKIIATAMHYAYVDEHDHEHVYLITDDINVRLKAASEEIETLPFEYEWVKPAKEIQPAFHELKISDADMATFLRQRQLKLPSDLSIRANEFVLLSSPSTEAGPDTMARYVYNREQPEFSGLRPLFHHLNLPAGLPKIVDGVLHWGLPIELRNLEQAMLMDVLMDPSVDLVVVESEAGTGKSYVTLAAALMQLAGQPRAKYESVMITRSLAILGKTDLGALPGDKNAKLAEYYNSYYDNLRIIAQKLKVGGAGAGAAEAKANSGKSIAGVRHIANKTAAKPEKIAPKGKPVNIPGVELMAFPHIRGRSIHNTFIILDEAQNTSAHEAKTFLTRAADGSKIVMVGDVTQIDPPWLNSRNNGLSVTASLFSAENLSNEERSRVAFVRLEDIVRSGLSELAVKVFNGYVPRR